VLQGGGMGGGARDASTMILHSTAAGAALMVELRMTARRAELLCLYRLGDLGAGALPCLVSLSVGWAAGRIGSRGLGRLLNTAPAR
jgi:hypothetical protein